MTKEHREDNKNGLDDTNKEITIQKIAFISSGCPQRISDIAFQFTYTDEQAVHMGHGGLNQFGYIENIVITKTDSLTTDMIPAENSQIFWKEVNVGVIPFEQISNIIQVHWLDFFEETGFGLNIVLNAFVLFDKETNYPSQFFFHLKEIVSQPDEIIMVTGNLDKHFEVSDIKVVHNQEQEIAKLTRKRDNCIIINLGQDIKIHDKPVVIYDLQELGTLIKYLFFERMKKEEDHKFVPIRESNLN